jgi:hypothetical protein
MTHKSRKFLETSCFEVLDGSVMEPQLFFTVPVPTFEKLWFRFRLLKNLWFRFLLLKSYGSGSGSRSGSSSISRP